MFNKIRNINSRWRAACIVMTTIVFLICIGALVWCVMDGNTVVFSILNFLWTCFGWLVGIFVFFSWMFLIMSTLSKRSVNQNEVEKLGINWEKFKTVLIASGWAEESWSTDVEAIPQRRIYNPKIIWLLIDPVTLVNSLNRLYGPKYQILLPLLKKKWNFPPTWLRWLMAFGITTIFWFMLHKFFGFWFFDTSG